MPQFDIFSFFSQLFWVFIAFSYLHLILVFYILPAFAITLKIRAKKLAQINKVTDNVIINEMSSSFDSSAFFETTSLKLNGISFFSNNLSNNINKSYNYVLLKNELFSKLNFSILNNLHIVVFFF